MASIQTARNIMAALGLAASLLESAAAQNPNYTPGDLVLFFQKEGDEEGDVVYANLGNAATQFRGSAAGPDASNQVNFLNLNAELVAAFGANWASDPNVYAGLCAAWGTSTTSNVLQDGDPHRTLYVSSARSGEGTVGAANSTAWDLSLAGNTAMTSGSQGITSNNSALEANHTTAVALSSAALSTVDNQNPVTGGVQGTAFQGVFAGGVQQVGSSSAWGSFGAAGNVEFALDLYRILAKNTILGQVAGDLRVGSYEGTITVNSSGQVSFIAQGSAPSSPYTAWADGFATQLPNAADREPGADPDADGLNNLMEFVLNGNPSASDPSIAPTLDASGSNFVFSFNRRDDSESPETTLVFQSSPDLVTWTDVTVGATGAGAVNVVENGTSPDTITVTLSKGTNTKLFGRLKVVR